jgi:peroxiredoxin
LSQRGRSRSILSGAAALAASVAFAAVTAFAAGHGERAQREVPGKVGTKAPAFTATLLTGETLDSRSLLGKVVVLKFWYVACGPCRQEIPQLNQMVDEFKDQPVVFLGLALDGPEKLRAFLEEMPYRYQVVPTAQPIIDAFGGTTYYPTHVVIDTRGAIVHYASGGGLQTQDVLRPIIRAALRGAAVKPVPRVEDGRIEGSNR